MTEPVRVEMPDWIRALAASHPFGVDDRRGTANLILSMPITPITNANLSTFAKPGLPLSSQEEVGGPATAWCDNTCLDKYFNTPGPASAS